MRLILTLIFVSGCCWSDSCDTEVARDCSTAPSFGRQPDYADPASVSGWVTAPSGAIDVAGATVETEVDGVEVWTLSAERGCFHVELPEGSHELSVRIGRYSTTVQVEAYAGRTVDLGEVRLGSSGARLAVVHGQFDHIDVLLDQLGLAFDGYTDPDDLYLQPVELMDYDVVFAACGSTVSTTGSRSYTDDHRDNVRAFVDRGGTLYASDWEYALVEAVAPEALVFRDGPLVGPAGDITAQLLDRDLIALVGETTSIHFELPLWAIIDDVDQAFPLVIGQVPGEGARPLAGVHFRGDGRIFYTSFHNEDQATEDMQAVLLQLLLTL